MFSVRVTEESSSIVKSIILKLKLKLKLNKKNQIRLN